MKLIVFLEIKLSNEYVTRETIFYAFKSITNIHFLFADALVRSDLVEQIPNVAIICHEAPHLFGHVIRNYLLDIVMKYLNDQDNQASESCLVFCTYTTQNKNRSIYQ